MTRYHAKLDGLEIDLFGVQITYSGEITEDRDDEDHRRKIGDADFDAESVTLWDPIDCRHISMPEAILKSFPCTGEGRPGQYSWAFHIRQAAHVLAGIRGLWVEDDGADARWARIEGEREGK
jgi:hypothetical protein